MSRVCVDQAGGGLLTHGLNEPVQKIGVCRHNAAVESVTEEPDRFDIVPLLNPWGWSRDVRYDRDGRDINRDFATFATQEARVFRDIVAGRRYVLAIDHHEDPSGKGFYLYQYAQRDTTATRATIDRVRRLGFAIEQDVSMVILRAKDGLIRAPRWGLWYMKATGQLSITNWLRLGGVDRVYTVETPEVLALEDRVALHRVAFASLAGDALEGGR